MRTVAAITLLLVSVGPCQSAFAQPEPAAIQGQVAIAWKSSPATPGAEPQARYAVLRGSIGADALSATLEQGSFDAAQQRQPTVAAKATLSVPAGTFAALARAFQGLKESLQADQDRRTRWHRELGLPR